MVYYRKYRPQKIEELDSKEVRDKLHSVLESPSVSHAFLFTGPKGLGKTSAARIVAKALNCERLAGSTPHVVNRKKKEKISATSEKRNANSSVEPCNKCEQCVSIMHGTNLDILEIDGASNRGIDEIRDLREKVKLSPMSARKKVYIIDEVHMLTQEAFNALLKTLEEPPSHVVFILCTTEPHKVPSTILSRCLHIQFKKATEEELVRSFERIIKREKLKSDKEALSLIASLSDGSFRDGVKILEEIVLIGGRKKITKELVEKNYSIVSIQYQIAQMIKSLEDKDMKRALEVVAKLTSEGVEMGNFMQGLIETLHNNMLFKAGVNSMQNSEFKIENLKFSVEEMKRLIELLSKAKSELRYAVLPQIPLELAIVEWGIQKTQNTQKSGFSDGQIVRPASPKLQRGEQSDAPSFPSVQKSLKGDVYVGGAQQGIASYSENDTLWTALIDKVKAYNHSIAGVLRGCRIKSYDGKSLILEAKFKFHKDKLSEVKTKEVLENVLKEVTKKNVKIEIILKKPA